MKNRATRKRWTEMTAEELAEATKQFDTPIPLSKTRPLSPGMKARWERARKSKPAVSVYVRNGRADIFVHLDDELLTQARAYARKKKTTLPKMIDRGLRGLLSFGA